MKIQTFKNGASLITEKTGQWYRVAIRNPRGDIHDKIRCDNAGSAREYKRAFAAVAKQL